MSKSLNSIYAVNYDPEEDFFWELLRYLQEELEKGKIDSLEKLSRLF
jgi:hypothetical protein